MFYRFSTWRNSFSWALIALMMGIFSLSAQAQDYEKDYATLLKSWQADVKGDNSTVEQALQKAEEALSSKAEASAFIKLGVAKPDEIPKLKKQIAEADDVARKYYKLALAKASNGNATNAEKLNEIRYRQCVIAYQQKNYKDAATLGEYVARKSPTYEYAPQAARVAMYSMFQVYNTLDKKQKDTFVQEMVKYVTYVGTTFKGKPEGEEAWARLADIALASGDREQIKKIMKLLPDSSPQKTNIVLKVGLSEYSEYSKSLRLPDDKRPGPDKLKEQLSKLKKTLEDSTSHARKNANLQPDYTLMASELALVQIYNDEGSFDQSIKLLEIPQTGLRDQALNRTNALKTPSGQTIASEVFKAALRSYMGKQDLANAERMLREMAGQSADQATLTKLYMSLALQMQKEVEDQKNSGVSNETLAKSLEALSTLLATVGTRKEGHTFGTLSWTAQSLHTIAEDADPKAGTLDAQSRKFYEKAAGVYQQILDKAKEDPKYTDKKNIAGIRVKLAQCQRRMGLYTNAIDQLTLVLRDYPQNLEAQATAAEVLKEQGDATNNPKYYDLALNGDKPKKLSSSSSGEKDMLIWGWNRLMTTTKPRLQYRDTFLKARYNLVYCRAREALIKKDDAALEKTEALIIRLHLADKTLGGEEWYTQYDQLLQALQRRLKHDVKPLAQFEQEYEKAAAKNKAS